MSLIYQKRDVVVSLNEIMRLDFEGCMDLFEALFFAEDAEEDRGILSDIGYEVLGTTPDGDIRVRISGDAERFHDDS